MKLLVVAAWEPELEHLRALNVGSVLAQGVTLNIHAIGIGPIDAAIGMTRRIEQDRPDHVVLVGTAGAAPMPSELAIGDVIVGREVAFVDPATLEGRAAMPYEASVLCIPLEVGRFEAAGARATRIYCTPGITTDDRLAAALASHGEVEHLEAHAVARACALGAVSCSVVLAIANVVGGRGRDEWRANHVMASARAAGLVHQALALR